VPTGLRTCAEQGVGGQKPFRACRASVALPGGPSDSIHASVVQPCQPGNTRLREVIVVSFDQNKLLVQRYVEQVVNEQNLAALDELLAADYTCHMSGSPTMDRDGIRGFFSMLHAAFPDQVETIDDLVAEGDKVAVRWSARMTHQGEFMGITPTGKPVTASGQGFVRVRDGKIVEEHEVFDALGLMQQLGAVPES
jgi:steroid delta-isomerase-like uncharacterized protein